MYKYKYKHLYEEMNKSGELFEVFEDMVGNWKEDKIEFIKQQIALESLADGTDYNE
tara:strand:+ start:814 stop:981 length:168 start_codon:yes stop_codon:yes gene_type:complete